LRFLLLTSAMLSLAAHAQFDIADDGARLTVTENDRPVAVYNYTMVEPERRTQKRFRRACYLHPVYALNGAVLTDDFPGDHVHHRGIFWTWPKSDADGREMDVWTLADARQHHEALLVRDAGDDRANIRVSNVWLFDDAPNEPKIRETVTMTFLSAVDGQRAIDFEIVLTNVSGAPFTVAGQTTEGKGYGGFCFRPVDTTNTKYFDRRDPDQSPYEFFGRDGAILEDQFEYDTPWAAVDLPLDAKQTERGGVAILQHPDNPGYPGDGWLIRHYGFLGQSWPHTQPQSLAPEESVTLRYRVVVFEGHAAEADLSAAHAAYVGSAE